MSGLADMDSKLEQTQEKNRRRAEKYRLRKGREEQDLRTKYQVVIRQNMGLIVEIQRLEMICQQLTTTLAQEINYEGISMCAEDWVTWLGT